MNVPPAPKEASDKAKVKAGVGLPARRIARDIVGAVLAGKATLSDELDGTGGHSLIGSLNARDRALVHMIALTSFRRYGQISDIIGRFYTRGLPQRSGKLKPVLITAIAQLLFMDVPAYAAIALAMRLVKEDRRASVYASLANAGLRRIAEEGPAMVADQDAAKLNTPRQLWAGWVDAYGEAATRAMAEAHLREPALDLTVKGDAEAWAARLEATVLPTGSLRLAGGGRIDKLPGYDDGVWWVQDTAASLPARLLGDVAGKHVVDLCAAPGGKTAQLVAAGARVTAVEKSPQRAQRLTANLQRLKLDAEVVVSDALNWRPNEPVDAVLLDAPCTATGTLRRHPDAAWTKGSHERDVLTALQTQLLNHAATLIRADGLLVYCTCSLEPAEGEDRIDAFLAHHPAFARLAINADEIGGLDQVLTPQGDLRTLPHLLAQAQPPGLDGFYAARMRLKE